MTKAKYLLEMKTDHELKLWPKTSREHYLSASTLPKHLVSAKRRAKISAPEELPIDMLRNEGILNSAITEHFGKYYQSRADEKFHFVLFTLAGHCELRTSHGKTTLSKNTVFVAPAGTSYDLHTEKYWKNIWFHIDTSQNWENIFEKSTFFRRSKFAKDIEHTAEKYLTEAYKPDRNLRLLEILSELISFYVKEEFTIRTLNTSNQEIENILLKIKTGELKNIQAIEIAKHCAISKHELNKICEKKYSMSFAQICLSLRMKRARKLISADNMSISDIAKEVGFANSFSFSKTFKRFHGYPPSTLRKRWGY